MEFTTDELSLIGKAVRNWSDMLHECLSDMKTNHPDETEAIKEFERDWDIAGEVERKLQ